MKKRILSIALSVVMVVAMVASMAVSVFASDNWDKPDFDVAFTTEKLTVDAKMDDVYWNSETISNAYTYYRQRDGVGFKSWAIATADGYYAYTEVADTTVGSEYMEWNAKRGAGNDVSAHDKVQYYFNFTYVNGTTWWGYLETDYYANNVDGEQFANVNSTSDKTLHHTRWKAAGSGVTAADTNTVPTGVEYATKILRDSNGDEYGWVTEFFIPWNVAGNVPAEQAGTLPTMAIGIQVNNDNYVEGAPSGSDANDRDGYCYSRYKDTGWWQGPGSSKFTPLNFKADSAYAYNFYTTSEHIEMDGKVDASYYNSTMIKKQSKWGSSKTDNNWWMYAVASLDGVYFVGHVDDPTMNNVANTDPANGEMFQIYLDWSAPEFAHTNPTIDAKIDKSATRSYNGITGTWMGWFQFDYEGYLTGSFDTNGAWLNDVDLVINKNTNPKWNGIEGSQNQYTGYDFELFIPYNNYMKNVIATQSSEYHFSLGVQVNDDCTYDGKEERDSINFDTPVANIGLGYYAHFENLPEVQLVYADTLAPHATGTTVEATSPLDGINTNGEYDDAEVIYINLDGKGSHSLGQYRVICDGTYVTALFEIIDDTPSYSSAMLGKFRDYIDVYTARWGSYHQSWSGGYVGIGRDGTGNYFKTVDNKENGWTCEYRWTLSDEEKALFKQGKFQIGISVQALDGYGELGVQNGDQRYYKYDIVDCGAFWTGGGPTYSQIFRRFTFGPKVETPVIDGANVALGESITLNYYATLGNEDTDAKLKVTMNDKVTYLGPTKTNVPNQYKFAFKGIAPQTIGDTIKAELVIDGKVVDTIADYSVLDNLKKLVADDEDLIENTKTEQLVYDLLAYCAAAQNYAGYKTDALVNEGYEEGTQAGWIDVEGAEDRTYTSALADGRFTAAGVYHANTNKIYAKLDLADAANATVTINGKPAKIAKYEHDNSVYIVYSEDIKVLDFDQVYTFVLTTESGTQTLTYSVNAYAAAKYESSDIATADFANALYAYGVAAKNYVIG